MERSEQSQTVCALRGSKKKTICLVLMDPRESGEGVGDMVPIDDKIRLYLNAKFMSSSLIGLSK